MIENVETDARIATVPIFSKILYELYRFRSLSKAKPTLFKLSGRKGNE